MPRSVLPLTVMNVVWYATVGQVMQNNSPPELYPRLLDTKNSVWLKSILDLQTQEMGSYREGKGRHRQWLFIERDWSQ